ncbi:2-succinylbenzoate--CoA ligase [Sporomusa rhizae]|uniref:class I adenylate-forming enzyme family protein n=1 Tax=Sporomusa rhizae TaxID=357999 RepID=UPI00352BC2EB
MKNALSCSPIDECAIKPTRLGCLMSRNAAVNGGGLAWIDIVQNEQVTYVDLFRRTQVAVERLQAKNLKPGQVVCVVLTRSGDFLPLLIGCIELDLILAPIEEDKNEVKATIHSLRPRLVLYASEFPLEEEDIPARTEVLSISAFMEGEQFTDGTIIFNPTLRYDLRDSPALLIKTSGTTGQPKFVELSEKNLAYNSYCLQERFACSQEDRFLCTLPWSHMNAIMLTGCLPLVAGATTVYNNITRSSDPIAAILETKATIASLTPTLIAFLLKKQKKGQSLKSLKFSFCGAAPLGPELWRSGEKNLECDIYQGYGLSETTCWITASTSGRKNDYSNVGTPLIGEVRIDTSKDIQLITQIDSSEALTQSIGEIQFRGPLLMCGYRFLDGKRSIKLTNDGFFGTGDVGYIDKDNNIKVVGRVKEIIIRSGINIVPETIDAIVRTHPWIADSKTVGIPDEFLGEKIITAYIPKANCNITEIELRRFTAEKLPRLVVPNSFVRVAELPRNRVGKIALGELRQIVSGDYAQLAFKSLNTWKFKRDHPEEPEQIVQAFQKKILMSRPLEFVAYWGAGRKDSISDADKKAMQRLREFLDASDTYAGPQATLKLILTDVHAILNGKPKDRVNSYLGEIENLCHSFGFLSIRSSELWRKAGLDMTDVSRKAESMRLLDLFDMYDVSADVIDRLIASAQKHVEQGGADEGLKRYLLACHVERGMFAEEFNEAVFLTYNDSQMNFLTPPLPTFPISSYQRDTAIKPWFCMD